MKNPFDSIQEPDPDDEKLACRMCGARIQREFCKSMAETLAAHICEDEPLQYYDFNDPRTVLEQREAYRKANNIL